MKAPGKIYYGVLDNGFQCVNTVQTSTTPDAYIRKDALLEWARKEADKSFNLFAREELGMEAREKGLAFERLIKHIESL